MTFPSGLNLYYFMFNLFSIAQQQYVNKFGAQEELVPIPADKRKKGFMAKLTEAAEKSAQSQQSQKKKKK
jgi:YidC/Oxa1 family membrane protein insertase